MLVTQNLIDVGEILALFLPLPAQTNDLHKLTIHVVNLCLVQYKQMKKIISKKAIDDCKA